MSTPSQRMDRLTAAELAAIPAGRQPEEDGLLACLECGRWYRGLGSHVALAHEISADDYRARHELPRGRGLWAQDARDGAGRRAAERAGRYPDAVRTRLRGTPEEVERAVAARRESIKRAGTQRLVRENYERMGAAARSRTRGKYDQMAVDAGYDGIDDLIRKTADEPARVIAELLPLSVSGAKWLRRLHAADFNLDHHPAAPATLDSDDLARLPDGVQPLTETHVLCRWCGAWLKGLPRHVGVAHSSNLEAYRERFALTGVPLVPPSASASNHEAAARRRDQQARDLGFADHDDLVRRTAGLRLREVAEMMDVSTTAVRTWRLQAGV